MINRIDTVILKVEIFLLLGDKYRQSNQNWNDLKKSNWLCPLLAKLFQIYSLHYFKEYNLHYPFTRGCNGSVDPW